MKLVSVGLKELKSEGLVGVYGPKTTESNHCLHRRPSLKITVGPLTVEIYIPVQEESLYMS